MTKTTKPFMSKRRENPNSYTNRVVSPREHRRPLNPNSLEGLVWGSIHPMMNNKDLPAYIPEWEEETLFLFYRLMDSPVLQDLYAHGHRSDMKFFIIGAVNKAKQNALRRRNGKGCKLKSSLNELEETFNVGLMQSLVGLAEADNDCGVSVDLDDIAALADNDDRLRLEADFRQEAIDMLLEQPARDRKIFLAKVFTKNSSKAIGEWLNVTETVINNRYHHMITEVRRRVG
jgi:DNA-directed RNA polymerase specialized sigma24 family protein